MGWHHKTTLADRKEIVRRYNAGESTKQIAHDFKITEPMVGYYARAAEAPRRRLARGSFRRTDTQRIFPQIVLRIDKETFEQVRELARKNNSSFNEAVRQLIENGLNQQ